MPDFTIQTKSDADADTTDSLERAERAMGFVPNLMGILANAPAAAQAYLDLGHRFESSSLSPEEQQVVLLATSFENACDYCMSAHSTVASQTEMSDGDLEALRQGNELPTERLAALADFTRAVVRERGYVVDEDVRSFQEAGFESGQILEVILGVAMKTLSNYTNHIARTPVDEAFEAQRWEASTAVAAD